MIQSTLEKLDKTKKNQFIVVIVYILYMFKIRLLDRLLAGLPENIKINVKDWVL